MMHEYSLEVVVPPLAADLISLIHEGSDVVWQTDTLVSWANMPTSLLIGCYLDDQIVGIILWQCVADYAEIANIVVHRDWRKKGIATLLMQYSIAMLREKEVRHLSLEVRAGNNTAQRLYENVGFRRSGERADYYEGNGSGSESAYVYTLEI